MPPRSLAFFQRLGLLPPWATSLKGPSAPSSLNGFGPGGGDLSFQNTDMMSVNNPSLYDASGEQMASGYSQPATQAAQSNAASSGGGVDYGGLAAAGLEAVQGAAGQPNVGREMRDQFAQQFGVNAKDLPKESQYLSSGHQRKQKVAIAASNLIPVAGPIVHAALTGFKAAKDRQAAARYFANMFNSVPDFKRAGLAVPDVRPSHEEEIVGGFKSAGASAVGPAAKVTEKTLEKAMGLMGKNKYMNPLGWSNREAERRAEKVKQIVKENKKKWENYQQDKAGAPAVSASAFMPAFGNDPRFQYLLNILRANTGPQAPELQKVKA